MPALLYTPPLGSPAEEVGIVDMIRKPVRASIVMFPSKPEPFLAPEVITTFPPLLLPTLYPAPAITFRVLPVTEPLVPAPARI